MSISRRNLSLLQRQLARGELPKPSMESLFQPFYHNFRTYPQTATLTTSATASHAHIISRRLSSDSSSSFISPSASIRRVRQKDKIGWKALSTRTNDTTIDDTTWLIPRKGTGKDPGCTYEKIISTTFSSVIRYYYFLFLPSFGCSDLEILPTCPGFDNFLKKGKNDLETDDDKNSNGEEGGKGGEFESSEDDTNSSANKNKDGDNVNQKKEDGDVFGSFRSKYSDNNTKNNSEGGNGGSNGVPPNFTGNTALLTLLLVGLSYLMIRNNDDSVSPTDLSREITWNDFCNYLLETGQVEKIVVTNNRTIAKVFLKRGSHGLPQHQDRQFQNDQRRHQGSANSNQMFDDSTTRMQDASGSPTESFDGMQSLSSGKTNQHQIVYRFAIGTVDSFEKKLEEAQKAVGVDALHEIPVQYTNESTTKSEVLGVLPSLFLMGAAFFFMRYAAGSMGGMGGSGGGGGGMGGKRFV
jgi:hypothetical protein